MTLKDLLNTYSGDEIHIIFSDDMGKGIKPALAINPTYDGIQGENVFSEDFLNRKVYLFAPMSDRALKVSLYEGDK